MKGLLPETKSDEEKEKLIKAINVVDPTDFMYDVLLGSGAFGRVRLVEHIKDKKPDSPSGYNKSSDSTKSDDSQNMAPSYMSSGKSMLDRQMKVDTRLAPKTAADREKAESDKKAIKPGEKQFAVKIQSKYQLITGKQ